MEEHKDRYVNRLDSAEMLAQVTARKNETGAINSAQAWENFIYTLRNDFTKSATSHTVNPDRKRKDSQTAYGAGILHFDFADSVREELQGASDDEEFVKKAAELFKDGFRENPFILEAPDLNACAWEPDLSMFCEVGERSASHILTLYPELKTLETDAWRYITSETMDKERTDVDPAYTVCVYHLETEGWIYDVLVPGPLADAKRNLKDGYLLSRRPNILGRPWYTITAGHLTSERAVYEMYRPLIGKLYDIVQELAILGTLLNSGALLTGRPVYQLVKDGQRGAQDFLTYMSTPSNERPVLEFDLVGDAVINPPTGFHYETMPVPDQQWLLSAYQERRTELREYGFPAPLSPDQSLQASASSGYQAAREQEQAAMYIEPALRNVAKADHAMYIGISQVIKRLDIPVTLAMHPRSEGEGSSYTESVTIKPEEIRDQDLEIEYKATPATTETAMKEADLRLVQQGMMSRQTWLAKYYRDPVAEDERVKRDQMAMQLDQMAQQDAMLIIQAARGEIMEQVATAENVPLAPAEGGPAPGEEARFARPPVPVPGAGSPIVPPAQPQNGINPDMLGG